MSSDRLVSAMILTRNERHNIERCLKGVSWAGEIVVIDDFSDDGTAEFCRHFGAKVHQRKYDYYGVQSRWGLEYCSHEWVFQVDADEVCSPELGKEILQLVNNHPAYSFHKVLIRPFFMEKEIHHGTWAGKKQVRLFKKSQAVYTGTLNHEKIVSRKNYGELQGPLYHYTYYTMNDWIQKNIIQARYHAENSYRQGQKPSLINFILRPSFHFFNSYIRRLGFLDGKRGLMVAGFEAMTVFLRYCFLYDLYHKKESTEEKPIRTTGE